MSVIARCKTFGSAEFVDEETGKRHTPPPSRPVQCIIGRFLFWEDG
jgi:hypothetical protein